MKGVKPYFPLLVALLAIPVILWVLVDPGPRQPLPPEFALYVKQPKPAGQGAAPWGNWVSPSAVASIDSRIFVLDTGNDRIVEVDKSGDVKAVLCESGPCQFLLKGPQALVAHDGKLYVANTGSGQVIVLLADGSVDTTRDLVVPDARGDQRISPSGIAVSPAGEIYVADTSRNLVLRIGSNRAPAAVLLDAQGENEKYQVDRPMGLALDTWENLYVANGGNGSIRKYSPAGRHLQEFSLVSNPGFFSPAYLAVDSLGNVYFTDNRRRMVYVFRASGDLAGVVGLLDASKVDSPGVLRDPAGLHIDREMLYVADRASGLFGFRVDPAHWSTAQQYTNWNHP